MNDIENNAEIWNLSTGVHIDIERLSAANEWDIEREHEKINSISPSVHVSFCLLYKHTNNDVFDDFPKISDHFPKIFQNCSEGLVNVSEDFPKIFRTLPKVAEDFRGGSDDVSIIQHHLWVLFKRLCYNNGNLKTCDNNLIFLRVKLSHFYMWKYMDFLSGRNPDKTLVFI